jgi:hypothetical protein
MADVLTVVAKLRAASAHREGLIEGAAEVEIYRAFTE